MINGIYSQRGFICASLKLTGARRPGGSPQFASNLGILSLAVNKYPIKTMNKTLNYVLKICLTIRQLVRISMFASSLVQSFFTKEMLSLCMA